MEKNANLDNLDYLIHHKRYKSNTIQILIFIALFFSSFYLIRHFLRLISIEFRENVKTPVQNQLVSRVVSSLHAVSVTLLSLIILVMDSDLHENKLL